MGYHGQKTKALAHRYGVDLEIVERPPTRWVVERTLAWLNKYRRLSKDYEYLAETSEMTLLIAMIVRPEKAYQAL